MRTFIAIGIPASETISALYSDLSANIEGAGIKFTDLSQNHVTLAFLGEISNEKIQLLHSGLSDVSIGKPRIILNLKGLGVFNKNKQPTTLWMGIEPNDELRILWNNLNTFLESAGITMEPYKKFSPHVTVGRVKTTREYHNIMQFVKKYMEADFGKFECTHFTFYQSTLTPDGPIYRALYNYSLNRE